MNGTRILSFFFCMTQQQKQQRICTALSILTGLPASCLWPQVDDVGRHAMWNYWENDFPPLFLLTVIIVILANKGIPCAKNAHSPAAFSLCTRESRHALSIITRLWKGTRLGEREIGRTFFALPINSTEVFTRQRVATPTTVTTDAHHSHKCIRQHSILTCFPHMYCPRTWFLVVEAKIKILRSCWSLACYRHTGCRNPFRRQSSRPPSWQNEGSASHALI